MLMDIAHIGPLTVHGYGLMIGIGVVVALWLFWHRTGRAGYTDSMATGYAASVVISGFIGAKVLYLFAHFSDFVADPLGTLGSEGFVVYGGLIFGIAAAWLWCRKKNESFLRWMDLILPTVAIGQGFGRIGCFFAGCCYGLPTDSPLGVVFPAGSAAPAGIPLWPVQIFSSVGDFLIALALLLYEKRQPKRGSVAIAYLLLYSVGRFVIEYFRNDMRGSVGIFSTSQFISLFFALFAVILLRRVDRPGEKCAESAE